MSGRTKITPKNKPSDINNSTSNTGIDKPTAKTKTSKRNRHTESSPDSTPQPPAKIQTTTTMTGTPVTIDIIRTLLAEQTQLLNTSMQKLGDDIKSEFQAKINQLNEKIDSNQKNVQQQINELKSNVTQCMEHTTDTDDEMQRIMKLNELKISGIAYQNEEKLNEIFTEIAKLVQFDLTNVNNVPSLTRIYKRNKTTNTNSPTPIVIVKFIATHIRNDFYRLYLNKIAAKQPITSDNIGLPSGIRIIIGENMTAKNYEIFVAAGKQKKDNKLCQVFTQDGLVKVKAVKGTKAATIRSLRELDMFIQANPTTPNSSVANVVTINTNDTINVPPSSINSTLNAGNQSEMLALAREYNLQQAHQQKQQ